jgi:hypothetical protein
VIHRRNALPLLIRKSEPSLLHTALRNGAHLAVLSGFALAQPLLDILGRNPEFFAIRRSTSAQIVLFALFIVFVPPVVLLLVELAVALASRTAAQVLHLVFVAGLVAVLLLHALTQDTLLSGAGALVCAAAVGVAGALLYARAGVVRSFLTVLVPAPLIFLALFISTSGISKLVFVSDPHVRVASVRSKTPVVLIVFDEFAPVSLMNGRQRIDAERYPNFAALARTSTWYRSATTVQWLTEVATPAILTGILPPANRELLPIYADHPNNIFTLLGRSYRVRAVESLTHMCPASICKPVKGAAPVQTVNDTTASLANDAGVVYLHLLLPHPYSEHIPAIDDSWGNFGQTESRESRASTTHALQPCARNVCRFTSTIGAGGKPTLYVLHALLPHVPYLYLPSGRRYGIETPVLQGIAGGIWRQQWPALQSYQRYLLQVGYTDRALGFITRRLRAAGIYDKALVVVLADHGVSFRQLEPRRRPTARNIQDIAFVPLFVKLPHQRRGRIDDRFARTIDVLPTIARVLHIRIPWHVDGRPLVGRRLARDATVSLELGDGKYETARLSALRALRAQALAEQLRTFGAGRASLYRIGPHPELLGRSVSDLAVEPSRSAGVSLTGPALLDAVDSRSDLAPTWVQGRLTGGPGAGQDLAIAVNGRIAAMTQAFEENGQTRFAAMVPESALRGGRNHVSVFAVLPGASGTRLEQLRGSTATAVLRARAGHDVVVFPAGRAYAVRSGDLRGHVQVSAGKTFAFSGRAADRAHRHEPTVLKVFVDGKQAFSSPFGLIRPQRSLGQAAQNSRYAFAFELPRSLLPAPGTAHRVRVLVFRYGHASELRYARPYPWRA